MAPQPSSEDFLRLFQTSDKDLFSERFYEAMDIDPHDTYHFNGECNNISVGGRKNEILPICKKYQRFLDKCTLWSSPNSQYDISLLLSYWLYEQLIKIYGDRNSEEISWVFGALQGIWASFFNYSRTNERHVINCKPDLKMVDHEDWENRKKLYDYYVDYDLLFSMAQNYHYKCDYYKKIKEISPVYKSYEGKCSTIGQDCPKFFYKFHKENHEHILKTLPCHTQVQQAIDDDAAQKNDRPSHHPPGHERGPAPPREGSESRGSELGTPHRLTTTENSGIEKKVTHTVLGAAPVLLTATMLYRYTPLGPWIRKLRAGSTNSMNTMDGFSSYTQETGDVFPEDTANYISYQPI